jgi:HEAT repeat protein
VLDLIQAFLLRHELRLDIEEIKTLLVQGRFLLLLDGLNELPSAGWREVEGFKQTYRQTPMIFTSRDVGRSLGRIKTLEMQPLNEAQMRQFVCTYLPESGEEMLRQLGSRLRELGQTPLLLWMLCSVYDEVARVPTNLGAAFRAFAEIYDNQLKANVPTYQESQYWWLRLLKHLAFKMLQGERRGTTCRAPTEAHLTISKPDAERVLRDFLQGKVAYPDDCAVRWLEDLLKYHLLQRGTDNRIEFRHQLIQEYYAAEYLWERLADISDEGLVWEYLNYLKWTEPLALMLALVEDEAQAVRVVNLALEVDLGLGARLAGEVKPELQAQTVDLVAGLEIPQSLRIWLFGITRSDNAIPALRQAIADESYSTLEQAIADENYFVRCEAVRALGVIGSEKAISTLLQALLDKNCDDEIRLEIPSALGWIGSEAAISALYQALVDEDSGVRMHAAAALEGIGSETAISALRKALADENSGVRSNAIGALGKIGGESVIPFIGRALADEDVYVRQRATSVLRKIGSKTAISALLEALEHEEPKVRLSAASELAQIGNEAAIFLLTEALEHEEPKVRLSAASTLGKIGNEVAIPVLLQALEHEDYVVGRFAASALGEIGNEAAIPFLIKALEQENDDGIRGNAASALGKIGSEAAFPALRRALSDESAYVRGHAASALGEIGSEAEVPHLLQVLEDEEPLARVNAIEGLMKIGSPEFLPRFSELLLTMGAYESLLYSISEVQWQCGYYNYEIATSPPPQEQTTADPLSHTLDNLNQTLKTMSETPKYDFSGASFTSVGSVTGDIKGDNIIGTQYNYPPEQKQNLAEAAKEIQQLLDQLAQTNPTLTESNNPIVVAEAIQQEIKRNPTFKQRLRSALKAGGIEALKAIFNHPLINIPIETIKGWIEAE